MDYDRSETIGFDTFQMEESSDLLATHGRYIENAERPVFELRRNESNKNGVKLGKKPYN